jgi:prevent-host-death family protein
MEIVNMHEAKTHLSKLVEKAVNGEPFIIARAGKPLVKVVAIEDDSKAKAMRRIGFLEGQFTVPDDIKTMFADEIDEMFYGENG